MVVRESVCAEWGASTQFGGCAVANVPKLACGTAGDEMWPCKNGTCGMLKRISGTVWRSVQNTCTGTYGIGIDNILYVGSSTVLRTLFQTHSDPAIFEMTIQDRYPVPERY